VKLALVRHGVTAWNAQGRIQGRTDILLSEEGAAEMARLTPPEGFADARVFTSPLLRARQTAELLGLKNARVDERLSEHFWGAWEGLTREEILARYGIDAFRHAGKALDFCPLDGETTRAFVARVDDFLKDVAREDGDAIAVTHRGVLRSAYALATGWDMTEPMPPDMDVSCALILELDANGAPTLAALNVPLKPKTA
jgi:probable phosphoglycerate mutase